jgi:hypothetical protein
VKPFITDKNQTVQFIVPAVKGRLSDTFSWSFESKIICPPSNTTSENAVRSAGPTTNGGASDSLAIYHNASDYKTIPSYTTFDRSHNPLLNITKRKIIMPPKRVKKVMTVPINVIFGHLQVSGCNKAPWEGAMFDPISPHGFFSILSSNILHRKSQEFGFGFMRTPRHK